jgi:hypothetical protein
VTAKFVVASLIQHWREVGLPRYAQLDNDMTLQGTHRYPDALGRVIRACLSLKVVPVFVPPHEMGFQAAIESYNGWWQAKVWLRFQHPSVEGLCDRAGRHAAAPRRHQAARIDAAPGRRPFPAAWELGPASGTARAADLPGADRQAGSVAVLGQRRQVSATCPYRLVRAEVDLSKGRIRFYTLGRREPKDQPLVLEVLYRLPPRPFQG